MREDNLEVQGDESSQSDPAADPVVPADDGPSITAVSELAEEDQTSGTMVTRRDLARAAAALGLAGAEAQDADAASHGKISYVICNKAFNEGVRSVAFSPGGGRLAAVSNSGRLLTWDTQALGKPLSQIKESNVSSVHWGFRDKLLVIDNNGAARCYDDAGAHVFTSGGGRQILGNFGPFGGWLILLDQTGTVRVVDTSSWRELYAVQISKPPVSAVKSIGATREPNPRIYLAEPSEIHLINPKTSQTSAFGRAAGGGRIFVSENSEKAGVRNGRSMDVFAFPSGTPWATGVTLGAGQKVEILSPDLDELIGVDGTMIRLMRPGNAQYQVEANVRGVTCIACSPDPRTYAWGGGDGRVVVHRGTSDSLSAENLKAAVDPTIGKIQSYVPSKAKLPYSDCTCTCNSVEVTSSSNDRTTQHWDSEHDTWISSTQPCGSPIPPGAICICNCVSAAATPIWSEVCTCNTICTCNTQSTGYTLSYWY